MINSMKIRHTVIFTWHDTATDDQKKEVIKRLNEMGEYLKDTVGITDWVVATHIPETFKARRAHLLQDCVFPSLEALQRHGNSQAHKRVIELTPKVCDWMTVDTVVSES